MAVKISSAINSKLCFWDKHPVEGTFVKCPIFYKPKQIVRKKKEYYINQNVERDHIPTNINTTFLEHEINEKQIFYDDFFCSLSCCLAWIEDNQTNPKYRMSKQILFNELLIEQKEIPIKANHWKLLESFGGFLTIKEFRENVTSFELLDFKYNGNVVEEYYQEKMDLGD